MNPKRFALFAGYDHYPAGGWNDFRGSFDTPIEAVTAAANVWCDWWHVIDLTNGERAAESA